MLRTGTLALIILILVLFPCAKTSWAFWVQNGIPLCMAVGSQDDIQAISDGFGGAIIVWGDKRNGSDYDIYAQRIEPNGNILWAENGVPICTISGDQKYPRLASDGYGGAIITWWDKRSSSSWDVYAQRITASGIVSWTSNGVAVRISSGNEADVEIAPSILGSSIIVWRDPRAGYSDIYAQRVSANGEACWNQEGTPICTATLNQLKPVITSDDAGGAIIAWQDFRSGTSTDIYAQRIDANSNVLLAADGVAICTANNDQDYHSIDRDGHGGAIIVWHDWGASGIYAQRITANGVRWWAESGIAICTGTVEALYSQIPMTADEAGGAIITWMDVRNYSTNDLDIYAQRIDENGDLLWGPDAAAICRASGAQNAPQPVISGLHGAIITWADNRNGNSDVYVQRLDPNGNSMWQAQGVPICTALGTQYKPKPVSCLDDGSIIAWTDYRNGADYDVYAQRIDATGNQPIATLLQSYLALYSGSAIEVTWTLSEIDSDFEFIIQRAAGSPLRFDDVGSAPVTREGLSFAYKDRKAEPGTTYWYRVDVSTRTERLNLFETGPVTVPTMPLALFQNQPNPFNPSTEIRYYLPERCSVALDIYNVKGALVARLMEGYRDKGSHTVSWDGRDRDRRQVNSGVYFYRLKAGKVEISKKMVLLR